MELKAIALGGQLPVLKLVAQASQSIQSILLVAYLICMRESGRLPAN